MPLRRGGVRLRAHLGRKLQGCDETLGRGDALAGNVERRAVVGRCAHERQAERDVDALVEGQRLDRDEGLVVIHRDDCIVARAGGGMKQRVGGVRTRDGQAFGAKLLDGGRDDRRDLRGRVRRPRRRAD